ncbi:hypothetical protein [Clostridium formicaceticum]|uniref:Uncharacterized protein n=1 Tax=Clostridium formicaceticum TaxID=1497 RepID=A0AAC9RM67_9CLOT|nr:hypothetical protein [Clostridium formicaceticum]AOY77597.1 hypothetical protein BJL90_18085 [Clostridium formicaceticum]ARE88177.1 hypothetical protein CLFO_25780 [Clostridium formicaceticum]
MKNKLAGFIIFIFITLLSFCTYHFFQSPKAVATFQSYSSPSHKIDKTLVELSKSEDLATKKEAEKNIARITLTAIDYEKWQEFIDYIDVKVYTENVLPLPSQQLIVALNLSKDLAVVVVFEAVSDEYIFHNKIEGIVPVDKIEFLSNPSHPYKMMVVYQTLDESVGAFFLEKYLEVYLYDNNEFINAWKRSLYYEETYKETWIDPNAREDLWNRVVEETVIDFIQDDPLKINTFTTIEKYTTYSLEYPNIEKFTLIHSDSYQNAYYWKDAFHTFILGEIPKEVFLSDVALLEDMEASKEVLFGIRNENYKVVTSKGEVLYLPKSKFYLMFQSLLEK